MFWCTCGSLWSFVSFYKKITCLCSKTGGKDDEVVRLLKDLISFFFTYFLLFYVTATVLSSEMCWIHSYYSCATVIK